MKNNLIRSSLPINQIHELIKTSLIELKVNPGLIKPSLRESKGEIELYGFIKKKSQDVCVINTKIFNSSETYHSQLFDRRLFFGYKQIQNNYPFAHNSGWS